MSQSRHFTADLFFATIGLTLTFVLLTTSCSTSTPKSEENSGALAVEQTPEPAQRSVDSESLAAPVQGVAASVAPTPELEQEEETEEVYQSGLASWYGKRFHGRQTASGEAYDMHEMTAAHKALPFGTEVVVRSLSTGKAVKVRINDRGPFVPGRVIDLSYRAAKKLGIVEQGHDKVEIYVE